MLWIAGVDQVHHYRGRCFALVELQIRCKDNHPRISIRPEIKPGGDTLHMEGISYE